MPVMNCVCGHRLEGADEDALYEAVRAHSDAAHADLNITGDQIRDIMSAWRQMTPWDGRTATLEEPVEVRELTPGRLDDFLGFFDRDAFADNPIWASCYCMAYHVGGTLEEWEKRTGKQNRADKTELIRRGEAQGYMAYAGGRPVAWCHAAPRTTLPGIVNDPEFSIDDDASLVGSIVCFVVAAAYRRQGLASRLLDAACDGLRRQGLAVAEAYPPKGDASDARAFRGPLDLYLGAGFERHRESERSIIVRKALA